VTGGNDCLIKLWDLHLAVSCGVNRENELISPILHGGSTGGGGGCCVQTLNRHTDYVETLSYSPASGMMASAGL